MKASELVREVGTLFSLPDVVIRLNDLIQSDKAALVQLAEVVELDSGLAATVLKLANSSWYGLPSRVDTVSGAVMIIGQKPLRDLALTASVAKSFRGIPADLLDMNAFWDRSTTCGVIARLLGRYCNVREEDRMFTAGLLLKVGKLVLIARRPVQFRDVLAATGEDEWAGAQMERRLFSFDHAELGAELLRTWKLPEVLPFLVGAHLTPLQARSWIKESAIVFAANHIAGKLAPAIAARQPVTGYVPQFDAEIWERLELDPTALQEVISSALKQVREIVAIVNPSGVR